MEYLIELMGNECLSSLFVSLWWADRTRKLPPEVGPNDEREMSCNLNHKEDSFSRFLIIDTLLTLGSDRGGGREREE